MRPIGMAPRSCKGLPRDIVLLKYMRSPALMLARYLCKFIAIAMPMFPRPDECRCQYIVVRKVVRFTNPTELRLGWSFCCVRHVDSEKEAVRSIIVL